MKSQTIYQLDKQDFEDVIEEKLSKLSLESFLNKYYNVFINAEELAKIHGVHVSTVYAYIKDGLLIPEPQEKKYNNHRFRLSYALTVDFKDLRKQLRAKMSH